MKKRFRGILIDPHIHAPVAQGFSAQGAVIVTLIFDLWRGTKLSVAIANFSFFIFFIATSFKS